MKKTAQTSHPISGLFFAVAVRALRTVSTDHAVILCTDLSAIHQKNRFRNRPGHHFLLYHHKIPAA